MDVLISIMEVRLCEWSHECREYSSSCLPVVLPANAATLNDWLLYNKYCKHEYCLNCSMAPITNSVKILECHKLLKILRISAALRGCSFNKPLNVNIKTNVHRGCLCGLFFRWFINVKRPFFKIITGSRISILTPKFSFKRSFYFEAITNVSMKLLQF